WAAVASASTVAAASASVPVAAAVSIAVPVPAAVPAAVVVLTRLLRRLLDRLAVARVPQAAALRDRLEVRRPGQVGVVERHVPHRQRGVRAEHLARAVRAPVLLLVTGAVVGHRLSGRRGR